MEQLSQYYDHYKDTFQQLEGYLTKRDRLTMVLFISITIILFIHIAIVKISHNHIFFINSLLLAIWFFRFKFVYLHKV